MPGMEKSPAGDEMDAGRTESIPCEQVRGKLRTLIGAHEAKALRARSSGSKPRDDFWSEPFKVSSSD